MRKLTIEQKEREEKLTILGILGKTIADNNLNVNNDKENELVKKYHALKKELNI